MMHLFTRPLPRATIRLCRFYATAAPDPFFHKEWPQHKDPTPYDVLGVKPGSVDGADLKKRYYETAKLYHPDTSSSRVVVNHLGVSLSEELKRDRFKLLTEAYALLKDNNRRSHYDQFKTGWGKYPVNYTSNVTVHNSQDYRYWNASTWEDYQDLKDMSDPALRPDKMKALLMIFCIMAGGIAIQGWIFLNNMESSLMARQEVHDACEVDLGRAYLNYGLDGSRLGRIRRFLWFRTFGMYGSTAGGLDEGAKRDAALLREVGYD